MSETAAEKTLLDHVTNVSDFIWGGTWDGVSLLPLPPMVVTLLGIGAFFMVGLRFYPILKLPAAFAGLFKKDKDEDKQDGEISPFAALSTALSGQVGTGNLAGVATAITLGGPGALFWMWMTAILGMALAFAEGALAIRYREKLPDGEYRGGPMYYIRHGLGPNWGWLAILFCLGTLFSSIATGNMIQANSIADSIAGLTGNLFGAGASVGAPIGLSERQGADLIAGVIVAVLVLLVTLGGIKSIGAAAEKIVPTMAIFYVAMALIVIGMNITAIPATFALIFTSAFTGQAAAGGFLGAGVMMAIRAGVARGLFSNEAGQGSTPMAHAAAKTTDPAKQGRFAMMGTFIDTIIICTATGLVLLMAQGAFPSAAGGPQPYAWMSDLKGFEMTSAAFGAALPIPIVPGLNVGQLVVSIALILFVFTTLITWSYYGERAAVYLSQKAGAGLKFQHGIGVAWRVLWCVMIVVGSYQEIEFVWRLGDIANAAMALPNLIALALLAGVVFALARGDKTAGKDYP
jgi:AGCS family alanine or glycine:cation symporter